MNESQLSEVNSVPQPDFILSRKQRLSNNVGYDYVDAANQAIMAQYNNDYNYWLWKQQMEYNSPSNQVQRLKEAGLNPNFNSIDGTGNVNSIPSSSGSISPSIGRNRAQSTQNIFSGVNALLQTFSEGLKAVSTLSDLPPLAKLPEYRQLLFDIGKLNLEGKQLANYKSLVESIVNTYLAGGSMTADLVDDDGNIIDTMYDIPFFLTHPEPGIGGISFDPDKMVGRLKAAKDIDILGQKYENLQEDNAIKKLVKAAKDYYNSNMQPKEMEILEGKSGMSQFGQVINKLASGERLSIQDVIVAILALAALKL